MQTMRERGDQPFFDVRSVWMESFAPPYMNWSKSSFRQRIDNLGISLNKPFRGLVARPDKGRVEVNLGSCLIATVLGPDKAALTNLHEVWVEEAVNEGVASPGFPEEDSSTIPKIVDECDGTPRTRNTLPAANSLEHKRSSCQNSPANHASLIILYEYAGRSFLHPGDSCSEQIEAGLRAAGLSAPDGSFYVDVLLLPRLGSANHVTVDFFRRVKAQQYILVSSGEYNLPAPETLQMILDARQEDAKQRDKYTMLFLNRDGIQGLGERLDKFFASHPSEDFGYRRIFRSATEGSIFIDLLERVRY
jgi:hypothetical protein